MFTKLEKKKLTKIQKLFQQLDREYGSLDYHAKEKLTKFEKNGVNIPLLIEKGVMLTEELMNDVNEERKLVLIFTVVEKLGSRKRYVNDNYELVSSIQRKIEQVYGIEPYKSYHESIKGAEAMNGDQLYFEIISNNNEAFQWTLQSFKKNAPRYRMDLDHWLESKKIDVIDTTNDIGMYDEYLFEFKKELIEE